VIAEKIRGYTTVRLALAARAAHTLGTHRLCARPSRLSEPLSSSCDAFSMPCALCTPALFYAARVASSAIAPTETRAAQMHDHEPRFLGASCRSVCDKMGPVLENERE
jgi:hypothetical protein